MAAILSVLLCLVLIGGDQFIKYLVVEYLKPIEYINVVDGFLRFRYVENTGAVFGSFATHTVLLTILSIILLVFTIYFLVTNKSKSRLVNFCLLLMISGGIGNIIDRIRLKYVVDYIEPLFVDFAVFNFADCLITVGAFALIIYLIVDLIRDIKKEKSTDADDSSIQVEEEAAEKHPRFARKRNVKKAGVEGDKEAVVFNAVIEGESPESALNEIKMGIELKSEPSDVIVEEQSDRDASEENVVISLADKNSAEVVSEPSSTVSEPVVKADTVKKADEIFTTAKNPESDIKTLKQIAESSSFDNETTSAKQEEACFTPTQEAASVQEAVPSTDNKTKKISIESIDDLDFSLFE